MSQRTISDQEAQAVLDRIREALDTPDLKGPFQRLVAVGIFLETLNPPTAADIRQAEAIALALMAEKNSQPQ